MNNNATSNTTCSSSTINNCEATTKWDRWVPMEKELFHAVQNLNLCMLQKLDEMLCRAGVRYWICGGTLLGALRHSGFIPHDDDIDIEVLVSDLSVIERIPVDPPLYSGFERDAG
eukprot:CAMPEP_0113588600 /NCGR_PEP_ID=MMETSP0015_2-20120614/35608_1 /TAXON_ID=2838 /ORGANISM="Odontella" /LENGTH=114 /DNA_ID=CAMNT_0000494497 /DNA_START=124 /DNA_END=464 /DNA_ORIENTATION=+ /assembly_acc=CAM_ASM_000160